MEGESRLKQFHSVVTSVAVRAQFGTSEDARDLHFLPDFFSHRFALGKQIQVIGPARLGIGAGHIESAEGMRGHRRARALAIDIEVADVELADSAGNLLLRFCVHCAREPELGIVGNFQRMVEIPGLSNSQDGAEDLFLLEFRFRRRYRR